MAERAYRLFSLFYRNYMALERRRHRDEINRLPGSIHRKQRRAESESILKMNASLNLNLDPK